MKLFFDFLPIIFFFIVFKIYGIYSATLIAIISSLVQVAYIRLKYQRFEMVQIFSCSIITVLGGATLFFQNPLFIKWKPTGLYWLFAILFLGSAWIGKKTLIQKIMENNISLPGRIWNRLNFSWALFFIILGFANLYVAYYFDTNVWVNFKLFGGIGLTFLFVFVQAIFLAKHIQEPSALENQS